MMGLPGGLLVFFLSIENSYCSSCTIKVVLSCVLKIKCIVHGLTSVFFWNIVEWQYYPFIDTHILPTTSPRNA